MRKQGFGSLLFAALVGFASHLGLGSVVVCATREAHGFWERQGVDSKESWPSALRSSFNQLSQTNRLHQFADSLMLAAPIAKLLSVGSVVSGDSVVSGGSDVSGGSMRISGGPSHASASDTMEPLTAGGSATAPLHHAVARVVARIWERREGHGGDLSPAATARKLGYEDLELSGSGSFRWRESGERETLARVVANSPAPHLQRLSYETLRAFPLDVSHSHSHPSGKERRGLGVRCMVEIDARVVIGELIGELLTQEEYEELTSSRELLDHIVTL